MLVSKLIENVRGCRETSSSIVIRGESIASVAINSYFRNMPVVASNRRESAGRIGLSIRKFGEADTLPCPPAEASVSAKIVAVATLRIDVNTEPSDKRGSQRRSPWLESEGCRKSGYQLSPAKQAGLSELQRRLGILRAETH